MPEIETTQDDDMFLLNGSALTMRRLDKWITKVSEFSAMGDIMNFRTSLLQLFIEGQGYLKPLELKEAQGMLKPIKEARIQESEDTYGVEFDDELPKQLHDFHEWFILKLHQNEATMGKKRGFGMGLAGLTSRYMKPPEAPVKKKVAA